MNATLSASLVEQLQAAFPSARLEEQTLTLWLRELRGLDSELGEKAVRSLIESCRFFPSIAELHEQYAIIREQRRRENRDEERRAANETFDTLVRVPLRDIPDVQEFLEANRVRPNLPEEGEGECSDCGKKRMRYRLGKVAVCASCALLRQRAGERVAAEAGA